MVFCLVFLILINKTIMDWILRCLFWIFVTTTTAYKCKQHVGFLDYPHFHGFSADYHDSPYSKPFPLSRIDSVEPIRRIDSEESFKPQPRRIDHENFELHSMNERSAEGLNVRPNQRMNERSIAVNSGVQRIQEQERRRLQTRTETSVPRTESGSYKIVNYPKTYPSIANRRGQPDKGRISSPDSVVFPGPTSKSSEFVPEVPPECKAMGFCENVPNYPEHLAEEIIAKLGEKRNRLHLEKIEEPEIAQRIGPSEDNIELCSSQVKIVKPHALPDKDGKWYFVLNSKDDPLQGYRIEVCNPDKPICGENIVFFNNDYTATCKQKFVTKTITVIDRDGKVNFDMPFQVPSCCSCVASHVGRK